MKKYMSSTNTKGMCLDKQSEAIAKAIEEITMYAFGFLFSALSWKNE